MKRLASILALCFALVCVYPTAAQQTQKQTQPAAQSHQAAPATPSGGHVVHSPAHSTTGNVPKGATAVCRDGSYSFSEHRQGTCSHHGGVARWL